MAVMNYCLLVGLGYLTVVGAFQFVRVKEHDRGAEISCSRGRVLWIDDASYGNVINDRKLCHSPSSRTEVAARCNMEKRCFIEARDDIFGDPCKGVSKRLYVIYHCYKPQVNSRRLKTVCEGHTSALSCPVGWHLHIMQASYGRLDGSKCRKRHTSQNTCHAHKSLTKVRNICEGRRSCHVKASNAVFGDPCNSVYKYLQITYRCQTSEYGSSILYKPRDAPITVRRTKIGKHQKRIKCPNNERILIRDAMYGRKGDRRCGYERATDKLMVQQRCQYSTSCYLRAASSIYGHRCPGVRKYLYVKYQCQ